MTMSPPGSPMSPPELKQYILLQWRSMSPPELKQYILLQKCFDQQIPFTF